MRERPTIRESNFLPPAETEETEKDLEPEVLELTVEEENQIKQELVEQASQEVAKIIPERVDAVIEKVKTDPELGTVINRMAPKGKPNWTTKVVSTIMALGIFGGVAFFARQKFEKPDVSARTVRSMGKDRKIQSGIEVDKYHFEVREEEDRKAFEALPRDKKIENLSYQYHYESLFDIPFDVGQVLGGDKEAKNLSLDALAEILAFARFLDKGLWPNVRVAGTGELSLAQEAQRLFQRCLKVLEQAGMDSPYYLAVE